MITVRNSVSFFILLILQVVFCFTAIGQQATTQAPSLSTVIPPSPTAAALGKYGEIPVSLYTGVPNISIPLYEIQEGDIKLPISLSYHASGIKVEEVASNVGLGWSLNAGGVITRTVRGLPDDDIAGYLNKENAIMQYKYINGLLNSAEKLSYEKNVAYRRLDSEPDLFNFNVSAGITGQFFIQYIPNDPQNITEGKYQVFFTSHTDIKVEYQIQDNTKAIIAWIITSSQGAKFFFDKKERTIIEFTGTKSSPSIAISSWFLSNITSKSNNQVDIEYDDYIYEANQGLTYYWNYIYKVYPEGISCTSCQNKRNQSQSITTVYGQKIRRIISSTTSIIFNYTNNRQDMPHLITPNEKQQGEINSIDIINQEGTYIKKYNLDYIVTGKLLLKKLIEINKNNNKQLPYLFDYYSSVPLTEPSSLDYYNQDHWGYFNNNPWAYLKTLSPYIISEDGRSFDGAERSPDAERVKTGVLTKITYPTGGSTLFTYESNKYNGANIPQTMDACKLARDNANTSIGSSHKSHNDNGSLNNPEKKYLFTLNKSVYAYITLSVYTSTETQRASVYVRKVGNGESIIGVSCPKVRLGEPRCQETKALCLFFEEGEYEVNLLAKGSLGETEWAEAAFNLQYIDESLVTINTNKDYIGGGLRIKNIKDTDQTGTIREKNYSYTTKTSNNIEKSSGVLPSLPYYIRYEVISFSGAGCNGISGECLYITSLAHSQVALSAIQGSYVTYSEVTVEYDKNGKEVYYYTTPLDYPIEGDILEFPYPPPVYDTWRYGLLKEKQTYSSQNGTYRLIKKELNDYDFYYKSIMPLMKIIEHFPVFSSISNIYSAPYIIRSGNANLVKSTFYDYSLNNLNVSAAISQTVHTGYSDKFTMPILSNSKNSNQSKLNSLYSYVLDYTFSSTPPTQDWAKGIKLLQDKHIIVPVIEQLQVKEINGQNYVVAGQLVEYYADKPLQKAIWVLELDNPILESQFVKSTIDANNNFVYDSRYVKRIDFEQYDSKGNLLQQRKTGDVPTSYLWGYNQTLPVAQVVNAATNEVFYTSFETESLAGIQADASKAKTGSKYFIGSYQPAFTIPNNRKYVISYFREASAGNWKYIKEDYTPNYTIPTDTIDEVRIYPADAVMSTMTYTPLIGKTSETDANGITTYYEYDSFNRLYLIRDDKRNIVQKIDYKYYND